MLEGLSPSQWNQPTSAGTWRVRDVVAHLLDGDLRRLAFHRDALPQPEMAGLRGYDDLLAYLNALNQSWIAAASRLSPRLLTHLVDDIGRQAVAFLSSLPPHEPAHWPVAWAGEGPSEHWMDVGRNYTEYWHHQQQIRDALGLPSLTHPSWLEPVIALGVRSLPPAMPRSAAAHATVHVEVTGPAGGRWWLRHEADGWVLAVPDAEAASEATAATRIDAEHASRVWFAARRPQPAAEHAQLSGDTELARAVLMARALMV